MRVIETLRELREFLSEDRTFHLYSAGFAAGNFMQSLKTCDIPITVESVLVTNMKGNPEKFWNIPVVPYDESTLDERDCILLTVSERFKDEILTHLKNCSAEIVFPSPLIFYNDVYGSIRPFAETFMKEERKNVSRWNKPVENSCRRVWTCWWQGEESAPDIVKACLQSQRENSPEGTEHIVITKDNYSEYITIPDYVLDKFQKGDNKLAHLADFIRACLLYKYGGVWLDATVLVVDSIPDECWTFPLYTWKFNNTHFASNAIWTIWFLAAEKGNILWRFVMEAFLYYFSVYDIIKYYFTMDYFIAICTNLSDEVLAQFERIPYNNESADSLGKHLYESYTEEGFRDYCKGTFFQKLNHHGKGYGDDSIYAYILHRYLYKNGTFL